MDGWNTSLSFWISAYFPGLVLLVLGRVTIGCFNWMMNQTFTWEMGGNHQFHPLKNGCCLGFQLHHQIQHGYIPEGFFHASPENQQIPWKFP